ncbi:MAG TPA: aminotransferase class V-fold PLP-dependent enzyme [Mycobacteriales bacterium]|nr:aminotransferase class V-fold PLP-dependent enzyme [Mycobacteriales bacterium]
MTSCPAPELVGAGLTVPLVTGDAVPYANFDYAASAPALAAVQNAVHDLLPWYASVHRGAGLPSQTCTQAYEEARAAVARFVGARRGTATIFTRNTTDAMNLLAHALPPSTTVVVFETEHHATLLPWRGRRVVRLPAPSSPEAACAAVAQALADSPVGPRLVAVTGASNVTGECWPVAELARVAHAAGARIVVDAAQLAPHHPVDMAELDVDYLALSGHKLYAPFGVGALIGRADWLRAAPPYLVGGGATRNVNDTSVSWAELPDRHEAGTPNVVGAVALAAACGALRRADRYAAAARETALLARLRRGLGTVPGLRELALWDEDAPRVGITSFTLDGWDGRWLATALSAEYGIGVRAGSFCAHPFVRRLTGVGAGCTGDAPVPVRASIGLGTTEEDVDRLVAAVDQLARRGAAWSYVDRNGEVVPNPDPRPRKSISETWF